MLPLVCNDAAAILLMFDLTRHETLDGIREWHRKARGLNKVCSYVALFEVFGIWEQDELSNYLISLKILCCLACTVKPVSSNHLHHHLRGRRRRQQFGLRRSLLKHAPPPELLPPPSFQQP